MAHLSVADYVLSRLAELGIKDIFGLPGDYAFPLNDAIVAHEKVNWIGDCNELNASYAADAYGRINGFAAMCTTYGVGELSAINGIAGAYAEHVPVFHLVGAPNMKSQDSHALIHHTLGNGEYDLFSKMTEPVTCARAILTPENCVSETQRLIDAAIYHRRPVYMAIAADYVDDPVVGTKTETGRPKSDPAALAAAVEAIVHAIAGAETACILPGIFIDRFNLRKEAADLVEASGLPYATMFMDKCVIDESHPNYIGMYAGQLMDPGVRAFVEGSDVILCLGTLLTGTNTGAFTANLDRSKTISVMHHHVTVGAATYENVEIADVLRELSQKVGRRTDIKGWTPAKGMGDPKGSGHDPITAEYLYPRWEQFLRPDDIVIAETGTTSNGMVMAMMPKGSTFHNQTLWMSIGWATGAAFGAAMAAPERRTVLITGEGAHQLTAQEICQFHRNGLKPIIFVLNNSGYLIERLLCKNPDIEYNDLAPWNYHQLPAALGCEGWFSAKATTCGELDDAIKQAETCGTGAYIEVVTDKYVTPPLAEALHKHKKSFYKNNPVG